MYKQPITDAVKVSKKGRLKLVRQRVSHGSIYTTTRENENDYDDEMDLVFENGKIMREQNFESIRAEANNGMKYARYMQYNFGNK